MTVATVDMFDAIGANFSHLPAGQVAGYVTGSGGVPWSAAQLSARPGVVTIAQSPIASADESPHPDFLDYEAGAVTLAELAPVIKAEQIAYLTAARPGQRDPGVYCSLSNVTAVANALADGGVPACPLGLADYDVDRDAAAAKVAEDNGPYPVVWYQYSDKGGGGTYDLGVVAVPWLEAVSKPAPKTIIQPGWLWCDKCQGLFYGPYTSRSRCPAGGQHNGSHSADYTLTGLA